MIMRNSKAFTIVELLIVVVVIAILAAISIVAYNGITNQANASAAQSAASQAVKKLMAHSIQYNDTYPLTLGALGISDTDSSFY